MGKIDAVSRSYDPKHQGLNGFAVRKRVITVLTTRRPWVRGVSRNAAIRRSMSGCGIDQRRADRECCRLPATPFPNTNSTAEFRARAAARQGSSWWLAVFARLANVEGENPPSCRQACVVVSRLTSGVAGADVSACRLVADHVGHWRVCGGLRLLFVRAAADGCDRAAGAGGCSGR